MTYGLVGYFAFMETVLGPIMPFLRTELDIDYTTASLHFSAFALGAVLLGLFGDRLSAVGEARLPLGGAFVMSVGAVFLVSVPSPWGTVPGAFVMGLSGALVIVTSQALLSDRHGEFGAVAVTESNITASACAIAAPLLVGASPPPVSAGGPPRRARRGPHPARLRVLVQAPRPPADDG